MYPPAANRINRQPRCVLRRVDDNVPLVLRHIIHAVGNRLRLGIAGKIMYGNFFSVLRRLPFSSGIGKIADKLRIFSVDTDCGKTGVTKTSYFATDQSELSISIRMRRSRQSFDIAFEGEFSQRQPSTNRGVRNILDGSCEMPQTQPNEFALAGRLAPRVFRNDFFEAFDGFGTFLTRERRPAPGLRCRPTGQSVRLPSSSCLPRETVSRSNPTRFATK